MNGPTDFLTPGEAAYENRPADRGCQNCGRQEDWYRLVDYRTDYGEDLELCTDCAAEQRRIEALAVELADVDGCGDRDRLVHTARSAGQLVNRLQHHDTTCAACRVAEAA
jgi:hypothetical protein